MTSLKEVGQTIVKLGAPLLGSVLAGQAGATVGQMVASLFGGDVNDPQELIRRINNDGEAYLRLREMEAKERENLQRLAVLQSIHEMQEANENLRLNNENTANARENNTKHETIFPQFLSFLIFFLFAFCIYWVAAYTQDTQDRDVLYLLLGAVSTSFGAVVNYWLGSSADKRYQIGNNLK